MRSILYIFAININEDQFITYSDTKANDIKSWKTTVNVCLSRSQFSSSSFQTSLCLSVCRQHVKSRISAVNQNASINKNLKSSNSRSLKQYTLAKSISLCCFCFCFCFRFVLRDWSFHHINLQISSRSRFSTRFSTWFSFSSSHISIFFLLAHFRLSNLSLHVYRIYFETFSVNRDQTDIWVTINEFLRNVDR